MTKNGLLSDWNSTVMVPLLRPQVRGPLVWDEYHHGYGKDSSLERALAEWIIGTPWGWALLQLVAVVLVAIGVSAVRFGPALSVIERKRRSPLEHLEALAAGLEGAAGAETALRLIVSGLRRRLSRSGYIPRGETGGW